MTAMRQKNNRISNPWRFVFLGMAGLSLIATVRTLFFGLDVDEEYALTLAYRLARGDLLIQEMWEPHQTSAVLPAVFLRIFLTVTGNREYLLLYMRLLGCLAQAGLSLFWVNTLRDRFKPQTLWTTAFIIYAVLPKWIAVPEFANQQIWFMLLTILFLYRYFERGKTASLVLAGVALALDVLAYPSCVLLLIPFAALLWRSSRKAAIVFGGTGVILGAGFVAGLLTYMRPAELLTNIGYILDDPEHGGSLAAKLSGYGTELLEIVGYLAVYAVLAFVFAWLVSLRTGNRTKLWGVLFLLLAWADQIRCWVMKQGPNVHPQLHYLNLFVAGYVLYQGAKKEEWKLLFSLTWWPSVVSFAAVLLLTNLDMKASFVHLLPGILCGVVFFMENDDWNERLRSAVPAAWVVVLLAARILLIRANEGMPEDVFFVKQKALYGAAKNVYCEYMTGVQLNSDYEFLHDKLKDGENVFYIGKDTLVYLLTDMEICTASTISTPVFNERYIQYFEQNPEKLPEAVIIDKEYLERNRSGMGMILEWIQRRYNWEEKQESEFLYLIES